MAAWSDAEEARERRLAELLIPPPQTHSWAYAVDEVRLSQGSRGAPLLLWSAREGLQQWAISSYECLDLFLKLADADDQSLPSKALAIAERWGALRICNHGVPAEHAVRGCAKFDLVDDRWLVEPIEAWRRYARHARQLLDIGWRLANDNLAPAGLWAELWATEHVGLTAPPTAPIGSITYQLSGQARDFGSGAPDELARQRSLLADILTHWFRYGNVEIAATWPSSSPFVRHGWTYPGLTGALAIQLHTALSDRVYRCERCGRIFPARLRYPKRLPRSSQRKYCLTCGKPGQNSEAQRRFREQRKTSAPDSQTDSQD